MHRHAVVPIAVQIQPQLRCTGRATPPAPSRAGAATAGRAARPRPTGKRPASAAPPPRGRTSHAAGCASRRARAVPRSTLAPVQASAAAANSARRLRHRPAPARARRGCRTNPSASYAGECPGFQLHAVVTQCAHPTSSVSCCDRCMPRVVHATDYAWVSGSCSVVLCIAALLPKPWFAVCPAALTKLPTNPLLLTLPSKWRTSCWPHAARRRCMQLPRAAAQLA